MRRLIEAQARIRRLAIGDRPGAIVLAEHAVDLHAEMFSDADDRLVALDALARDLIRMARAHPEILAFLRHVDDYIQIVQREIEAARSPVEPGAKREEQVAAADVSGLTL